MEEKKYRSMMEEEEDTIGGVVYMYDDDTGEIDRGIFKGVINEKYTVEFPDGERAPGVGLQIFYKGVAEKFEAKRPERFTEQEWRFLHMTGTEVEFDWHDQRVVGRLRVFGDGTVLINGAYPIDFEKDNIKVVGYALKQNGTK